MTARVALATPTDWERVRSLRLAALADSPDAFGTTLAQDLARPAASWRARLGDGSTTLIGSVGGRDGGLAVVGASYDDPDVAGLYAMWVAPHARGHGLGDALITAALDAARAKGWSRIVLDVGDTNAHAIALYARHGFEPTGRTSALDPPRQHITEHERARDL